MLAIKKTEKTPECVANVLPCRIQHNGPVNATPRHWNPETNDDEEKTKTAYFRGRKLCGKTVSLPQGYKGSIIQKTNDILPPPVPTPQDTESAATAPETKIAEEIATFDGLVVWGHEVQPDAQEDAYVRGVGEWIGLATAMNSWDDE